MGSTIKPVAPTTYRSKDGTIKAYRNDAGYQDKFGTSRPDLEAGKTYNLGSGQTETGTAKPKSSSSSSTSGSGNFDLNSYINSLYAGIPDYKAQAEAEQANYEKRMAELVDPVLRNQEAYLTALSGRSNLEDYYKQLRSEKGLDTTEALMKNLEGQQVDVTKLLSALPESVNQRTTGRLVTEAQRRQIEASERSPLTSQLQSILDSLTKATAGYGTANQAIQNALTLRTTQEDRALAPVKASLDFAGENLTGSRADAQTRLQTMLGALSEGNKTSLQRIQDAINARLKEEDQKNSVSNLYLQNQLDLSKYEKQKQIDQKYKTGSTGTATERAAAKLAALAPSLESIMASDRNQGERGSYTTIAAFRTAMSKAITSGIDANDFVNLYSNQLSPYDRIQYGIGTTTNYNSNSSTGRQV